MTRNLQMFLQIFFTIAQFLIPAFATITHEQAVAVTGCIAAVQGILGFTGANYNPDGTPAKVAYRPIDSPKP